VLLADCLLLPVLRPTIFAITLALYGDDVMIEADSALRVLGRADFSFGGGDNSARIAIACSSPGCGMREAGKLTSQALEGTVLAVEFCMMSLAAGTDTDTGGEVTSREVEGSMLAVELSVTSLAAGTDINTGGEVTS